MPWHQDEKLDASVQWTLSGEFSKLGGFSILAAHLLTRRWVRNIFQAGILKHTICLFKKKKCFIVRTKDSDEF